MRETIISSPFQRGIRSTRHPTRHLCLLSTSRGGRSLLGLAPPPPLLRNSWYQVCSASACMLCPGSVFASVRPCAFTILGELLDVVIMAEQRAKDGCLLSPHNVGPPN